MLRKFKMSIDGKEYLVELEEIGGVPQQQQTTTVQDQATEAVVAKQPVSVPTGDGTAIEAPMPGTILDVAVNVGDTVVENQRLLILEAMKMENEIVAPQAGTITGIHITKNEAVDAGQVLMTIK